MNESNKDKVQKNTNLCLLNNSLHDKYGLSWNSEKVIVSASGCDKIIFNEKQTIVSSDIVFDSHTAYLVTILDL